MAFGIIRARNLKASDIKSTEAHNNRTAPNLGENINPEGRHSTYYLSATEKKYELTDSNTTTSLQDLINRRLEDNKVTGIRKNSNLAIEYVMGLNDKSVWGKIDKHEFFRNCVRWIRKRHGEGSVLAVNHHDDESNPHIHVIVVPLITKEVKWKNANSEGSRIETRLDTRSHTGGPDKLRTLQDDYFYHLKQLDLPVPIYRGTLKENQTKQYIRKADHKIGQLRSKIAQTEDLVERLELKLEAAKLEVKKQKTTAELIEIEATKKTLQKKWKNRGTRDNPETFHTKKKKPGKGMGMG